MIKLRIFRSGEVYDYKNKKTALSDVRGNGLKGYEYSLKDTSNNTTYKSGLWLTEKELDLMRNGANIRLISIIRRGGNPKRRNKPRKRKRY